RLADTFGECKRRLLVAGADVCPNVTRRRHDSRDHKTHCHGLFHDLFLLSRGGEVYSVYYRGNEMDRLRLEQIEQYIVGFFQSQGQTHILARDLFDSTPDFANADMVRALEDME